MTFLWNDVYKGLEIRFAGRRVFGRHYLWLGWTNRECKKRGW